MRCMHQKRTYALYAGTQLRKRLHTMHTKMRIGVSVGLRARKCMHLRMHTDCIQSAYRHIREGEREKFLFYFFFIARAFLSSTARDLWAIISYCSRLQACTDTIGLSKIISLPAYPDRGRRHVRRSWQTAGTCSLYALYASKSSLCTLCGNTTPKKTAYNAYRNANRRVRRAEGLKMYAVGDAYRLHTKCIQVSTNT